MMNKNLTAWILRNKKALCNALWLAEEWEASAADATLPTRAYKPTPEQIKRSGEMKRAAKRYAKMREYLKEA